MDKYCRDKLDIPVETHGNRFMQIKSMDQFYICVKCNGTGLDHIRSTNGEFTFWSGEDCEECPAESVSGGTLSFLAEAGWR